MPEFILYLHGRYPKKDLPFYKRLARGRTKIAVDGGLKFFINSGIKPDLIIGDFDSVRVNPHKMYPAARVYTFPIAKNKTDTQLAVEHALKAGASAIDIVEPIFGEADHFAGNLMLLASLVERRAYRKLRLCLVNAGYEVVFINSGLYMIRNAAGDTVSVVPLSPGIRLTCTGTAYPARNLSVRRGETVALRNKIVSARAVFEVRGQAFLFHQFSR